MKKLIGMLGVFVLVVGMMCASLALSSKPVNAATAKDVTVNIYKSSKVTTSNSTLKSYVTYAMGKIDDAASDVTLNVTVKGPYSRSWSGCYDDFDGPYVPGNTNWRLVTVNYFAYQLHYNGYAECMGAGCDHALVDLNPTKWGTTCTGKALADWYNKKLVTHELGHLFGADDRCLYDAGVMDKCGCLYCTSFGGADSTLINNYLKNEW